MEYFEKLSIKITQDILGYVCGKKLEFLSTLLKSYIIGTSLVVQWLSLRAPNVGGPGSIPGQGTRSRMLQLKVPHAATKGPACHN